MVLKTLAITTKRLDVSRMSNHHTINTLLTVYKAPTSRDASLWTPSQEQLPPFQVLFKDEAQKIKGQGAQHRKRDKDIGRRDLYLIVEHQHQFHESGEKTFTSSVNSIIP